MKLINQKEKFHFKIGDGSPQRGKSLFDLFPQLVESFEYIPECGYNKVKRHAYHGKWSAAPQDMYLEANSHLEAGNRIETFLPDLETSYLLPYVTTNDHSLSALNILGVNYPHFIGIYTSAYSNARHWNGWTAKEWLQLIRLIQKHNPSYKFVIIGADYDIGIPQDIMMCLKPDEYINTIGQPLGVVVEILKRLDCFIGFPSGLSIINETIGAKQTIMFYPSHLQKLINAWPDPKRIESGQYKGCLFCEPELIFDWMINNNKI
jgi:ADP-heptose:LPS heptosyltransferase